MHQSDPKMKHKHHGVLAKTFAKWIWDDSNGPYVKNAITKALKEYEATRESRMFCMGVPAPASAEPNLFLAPNPATGEEHSIAERAMHTVGAVAVTALNRFQIFSKSVLDEYVLTNTAKEFREGFGEVTAENAKLAFFYIGNMGKYDQGWKKQNHNGIGRCSLKTLTLAIALDEYISKKLRAETMGCANVRFNQDDDDDDNVLVNWDSEDAQSLAICIACYDEKTLFYRTNDNQAKEMFCHLISTPEGALALNQLNMIESQKPKPKPEPKP